MAGIIDLLHSVAGFLPTVQHPTKPLGIQEKLIWTGAALVIFFMMYHTTALGVETGRQELDLLQTVTASRIGSLLTAGIGPIVLASIFLQLFNGAGILHFDLKNKKDKQKFSEVQKILAIVLALVEGIIFVATARIVLAPIAGLDIAVVMALVVAQIAMGSIIIIYLDELVTKYGIGSGISLFIAAGVSFAIAAGFVGLIFGQGATVSSIMAEGGATAVPDAIMVLMPFIFTLLVFLAVVYAESIKVEIPIAFERVRGLVPKLPLKFFYVSNIPVIFASALIMNIQLFAGGILLDQYWDRNTQIPTSDILEEGYSLDKHGILPVIGYTLSDGRLSDGILYMFTPVYGAGQKIDEHFERLLTYSTPVFGIPEWLHAIVYVLLLSLTSVLFGMFWVEIANMDAKSVASQLSGSGLQIPGFRRDPRMLETILSKNIFPLTVMGSFAVGLLAGIADLTGALGTGTGILLTVGILYRMYEQLEQMNLFQSHPSLARIFGE